MGNAKKRDMLMMQGLPQKQYGVNMVELVIAMAVLAIIVSIALPSYRLFIENTQVRTVGESILNGLQVARAEAVRRNADVRFEMLDETAWQVCLQSDADCDAPIQSRESGEGSSSLITVTLVPPENTIVVFNAFGTVKTSVALPPDTITISGTNPASRELSVQLGLGGSTKLCDPNADADDPRSC